MSVQQYHSRQVNRPVGQQHHGWAARRQLLLGSHYPERCSRSRLSAEPEYFAACRFTLVLTPHEKRAEITMRVMAKVNWLRAAIPSLMVVGIALASGSSVAAGSVTTGAAGTHGATSPGSVAYVANSGCCTVTPIRTASNTPEPKIRVGATPWKIAITPNGATAYVVNNDSATVTPIRTATNTPGPAIKVGVSPTEIAITPNGATAYVTNFGSGTVTPISTH